MLHVLPIYWIYRRHFPLSTISVLIFKISWEIQYFESIMIHWKYRDIFWKYRESKVNIELLSKKIKFLSGASFQVRRLSLSISFCVCKSVREQEKCGRALCIHQRRRKPRILLPLTKRSSSVDSKVTKPSRFLGMYKTFWLHLFVFLDLG